MYQCIRTHNCKTMAYSGATELLQTLHPGAFSRDLQVLKWHVYYYHKSLAEEISHLHNWVIEVFLEVSARTVTCLDPKALVLAEKKGAWYTLFVYTQF